MEQKLLIKFSGSLYTSHVARKPALWYRYNKNRAVQLQKMVICLKFWIKKEEGSYFLYCENKGALICTIVVAYVKTDRFSQGTAHITDLFFI